MLKKKWLDITVKKHHITISLILCQAVFRYECKTFIMLTKLFKVKWIIQK